MCEAHKRPGPRWSPHFQILWKRNHARFHFHTLVLDGTYSFDKNSRLARKNSDAGGHDHSLPDGQGELYAAAIQGTRFSGGQAEPERVEAPLNLVSRRNVPTSPMKGRFWVSET